MLLGGPDWHLMDLGDALYKEELETLEMIWLHKV
jgi:hypothetical protein